MWCYKLKEEVMTCPSPLQSCLMECKDKPTIAEHLESLLVQRDKEIERLEKALLNEESGHKFAAKSKTSLQAKLDRCYEALRNIAGLVGAPNIDPVGDEQTGLHCGVEDRDCIDRYNGADYGYTQGMERGLEWAKNEAITTLEEVLTERKR